MSKQFISRGLPYCASVLAFGNLLWLNLALAPVVFASQTQGGDGEHRADHQANARLSMDGEPTPGMDTQALEANQSRASELEKLSGRCDDSASHEVLAFVEFETNATEPTASGSDPLLSLVDALDGGQPRLWVDGHADGRGASEYNSSLSLLRAQAISDRLIGLGMQRARIEVRSFGETTPLVSPRPALQWKNRQAVICIEKASL